MVTAISFPYIRPRRSLSYKKKGAQRPPPLKLQTTFFQPHDQQKAKSRQRKGSTAEPETQAVRGSFEDAKEEEKEGDVPIKKEIIVSDSDPSAEGEPLLTPTALEKTTGKSKKMAEGVVEYDRGVSPQNSLRTIIQLEGDDSDNSDISPISDRPPVRPGSALLRFFPELSTNVDLVSPISTDRKLTQAARGLSLENELEERVQNLVRSLRGEDGADYHLEEQKTSSSSGSDDIFDGASSCYSRRSSMSSLNTVTGALAEKDYSMSADTYSIISPVAAGVFDDAASICPSRVPSVRSRLQVPPPSRSASASPIGSILPSRCNSIVSMNDLKNKPLPLEPPSEADFAPSPLAVRHHNSRWDIHPSQRGHPIYANSEFSHSSPSHTHLAVHHSTPTLKSRTGTTRTAQHSCHACQGCGGHSARQRKTNKSQWADRLENGEPHIRQLPSLAQAAEELEDVLADLQKDGSKQRTLLILDGPLQVSRHNGDLVATRPAPLPPSTKPHSQTHPSPSFDALRSKKSTKSSKSSKSSKSKKSSKADKEDKESDKPKRAAKVKRDSRPIHLAAIPEDLQNKDKEKGHKKSKSVDDQLVNGASDKDKESDVRPSTSYKDEDGKKEKPLLKKSFTFSMKSFKRNKPAPVRSATAPLVPLVPSSLSSSSDSSLDPLSHPLQGHSSISDPNLDGEDTGTTNRTSLLLQLPRLQTKDLELTSLYDRVNGAGKGVARSTVASRQASPQSSPQSSPTHPASPKEEPESQDQSFTPPDSEEKIVVEPTMAVERTRQMHAFVSTAQASSVKLPSDQVYELAATPPSPTSTLPVFDARQPVEANINFPPDFPVRLTMSIMESIDSLDDLFNFVLVNKRFYCIFKRHELPIIKNTLFKMSPPAWELREMSPPWATETQFLDPDSQVPEYTSSLYLDRYAQDIMTLAKLKAMILVRCSPFLRRDTVRGLSGLDMKRAEEVDDAFWRIWTFCRIFGSNKGRENDLEGQVDWLRGGVKARGQNAALGCMSEPFGMSNILFEPPEGFSRGNGRGLSPKQLYDMTEIWTCMGVLLQPLHGKCLEARRVGIYDGMDVPTDDPAREEQVLEEWTSFIMTIGLSAVLDLSSLAPAEATAAFFNKAKASGLTKWSLTDTETSRSSFLKEAVSRVYEDHERSLSNDGESPMDVPFEAQNQQERQQRHAAYKQELRARRARGRELGIGFATERPMSEFSTIVHNLDDSDPNAPPVPAIPAMPSLMLDGASTSSTNSVPPPRTPNHSPPPLQIPTSDFDIPFHPAPRSPPMQQATFFPPPASIPAQIPLPAAIPQPSLPPQVQDPVDRAINHMVNDLGFELEDVKWALKITDTGEGIDPQAAESLLNHQKQKNKKPFSRKESLLHSVMKRQRSNDSGWRFG